MAGISGGPTLDVKIEGIPGAQKMLQDIARRGLDMRPAMQAIRVILFEGNREQFESDGGFLGTPWAPENAETIRLKSDKGIPSLSSVLVESGDLRESLSGGAGSRSRVGRGSVRVGTSLFYAHFAFGTEHEPARPPTGINELETQSALRTIENYLLERPA